MLCILETNNGGGDITTIMDCFGQENSDKLLMLHFHLLIQVKDSSFITQFLSYQRKTPHARTSLNSATVRAFQYDIMKTHRDNFFME